ncbi:MAG: bifunctional alpha/beta hydrolase/OsmC family protein [Gemmatimonadota bacterium]
MSNERLTFTGAQGAALSARLSLPDGGRVTTCALFAHCFTCSKDSKAAVNIGRALTDAGLGVLRFDFTGLGESEGDFAETSFSSNVDDLVAAAEFMKEHAGAPGILIGHSLGGAAVLRAAARIDSVRAVATIGAPFDPVHVKHLFADSLDDIERRGEAQVSLAGRKFTVSRDFVEDLDGQRMEEAIRELSRPLLIFHSPIDTQVGIENAAKIYAAARHPKSFVSLDDADHLLLKERDSTYVGSVLAAWARRYVDEGAAAGAATKTAGSAAGAESATSSDAAATPDSGATAPPAGTVLTSTAAGAFRTEIRVGRHALLADEPASVGGGDLGPTPYDLLAAALGACTTMTLKMYAERKGWPLEEASVLVRHSRVHADDADRCEDREPRVDRLERSLSLRGDLDAEQRERLLDIADRCPVHRTLSAGVLIDTELTELTERAAPTDSGG